MAKPRTVLIDGSSLAYRAFFALPASLRTPAGLPTNAIYGFARMFIKVLSGRSPTAGAVVFDAPGPTFRDRMYPAYKADRVSTPSDLRVQFPWIEKLVVAHRFPLLRVEGVEADDVIGTLTKQAVAAGHEVLIVSIDKDFTQLLADDVRMIDTMHDIAYDPEIGTRKWGVPPERWVDLVALIGDKLDNIPGVPGIGKKGAVELVNTHGTIEAMLERVDALPSRARKALREHGELALLCKRLATIRVDVELPPGLDLPGLALEPPDPKVLDALYQELAFYSLLSEEGRADAEHTALQVAVARAPEDLRVVAGGRIGVHVVAANPGTFRDRLVGLALANDPAHALYVPWPDEGSPMREPLLAWLADASKPKIVHGARHAWALLQRHGATLAGVVGDPGLASFLVDPGKIMPHRADQVGREYLQRPLPSFDLRALDTMSVDDVAARTGAYAAASIEVWPLLHARMQDAGVLALHDDLDLPLSYVLGRIQLAGVAVDRDDLLAMGEEFARRKTEVEARIFAIAGHAFNVDSPKQLATVLFEEQKLTVWKRTKTGYSTAADVLERLAAKHEIAALVLEQRALSKLISTYTNVLVDAVARTDGRIHAAYEQTMGVSGRIICTDPDLQRTPVRTAEGQRIRRAFHARPGWQLVSADWSQLDLRILAHMSGDARLLAAFADGADVHARTAAQIFDVPLDAVTVEQRRVGKTVNYATIYGQGATALAQLLGMTRPEAVTLIERYFAIYEGVRAWRDRTIAQAHAEGGVRTLHGRRRLIAELSSRDATERAHGERMALNNPIQGTAADLSKLAMLAIDREIGRRGLQAALVMMIHDELVLEAPAQEIDEVCALVRDAMERPCALDVPLVVDLGVGPTWAEAHA